MCYACIVTSQIFICQNLKWKKKKQYSEVLTNMTDIEEETKHFS